MFYCRESELRKMNRRYDGSQFECIVIYGRRRVGKTALINQFCEGKPVIYFSALRATAQENLTALSKAICEFKEPGATSFPEYHSYDDAFAEITRLSNQKRMIFVIDEYPYLANAKDSVSSQLQHLIDHVWSDSKLYLILCGSSMSFMEYQVLGYESPLYGRRTAQFKIEPLTYKETAVFHPELSCEENALLYGITGGIPHYINKLFVKDSIDDALLENLFDRAAYLFEEPENLLKQELREPAVYNSIITAIASGASRMNEIAGKVGIDTGPCAKYMKVLIDLGIIKRETPVTEKPGRKTIYQISDNFFRFWYRFVPENMAAITSGRMPRNYDKSVKPFLSDYMGLIFEKMCKEYLMYYAEDLPIDIHEIGQWWGSDPQEKKEIQIDIVASSTKKDTYLIGSCKFRNRPVSMDELELIKHYASAFGKGKQYYYFIFSKGGFTEGLKEIAKEEGVTLLTLEDLY